MSHPRWQYRSHPLRAGSIDSEAWRSSWVGHRTCQPLPVCLIPSNLSSQCGMMFNDTSLYREMNPPPPRKRRGRCSCSELTALSHYRDSMHWFRHAVNSSRKLHLIYDDVRYVLCTPSAVPGVSLSFPSFAFWSLVVVYLEAWFVLEYSRRGAGGVVTI